MHSTTIFSTVLLAAASIANAQSSPSTTSSHTTLTLTTIVEEVIATITATGNPPPESSSSSVDLPVAHIGDSVSSSSISAYATNSWVSLASSTSVTPAVPYGYGNATSAVASGTGASTGSVPSQTYVPASLNDAELIDANNVAVAMVAGLAAFVLF